jgi:hypothetical protein
LRLQAEVRTQFLERDLDRPAHDRPLDDLLGRRLRVRAAQRRVRSRPAGSRTST